MVSKPVEKTLQDLVVISSEYHQIVTCIPEPKYSVTSFYASQVLFRMAHKVPFLLTHRTSAKKEEYQMNASVTAQTNVGHECVSRPQD